MPKQLFGIGMRNIKTAIAVFICCLLYSIIGANGVMLAAISAILCMQATIDKSVDVGKNRVTGSFIGGIVGAFAMQFTHFVMGSEMQIVMVSLSVVLIIFTCNLAKVPDSSGTACVVFLVIVYQIGADEPFIYALSRVIHSLIGIGAAIFVNIYFDLDNFKTAPDTPLQEQNIYPASVPEQAEKQETENPPNQQNNKTEVP
ncbi:MAG: aromatic acid exporter family protein [Clostridia bacterium]|jgi:uncharacterized membrane protein YgaE (UPF0421/DUF939 family)|nr:aromatic acid exporter family protein [Clostridia bacterium]